MGLSVNGNGLPWAVVISILTAFLWLGGLSVTVADNKDKTEEVAENSDRLARIEERQRAAKEDIEEIKEKQDVQAEKLDKALALLQHLVNEDD